jgi:hypothetical protein
VFLYYTGVWLHVAITSVHPQAIKINDSEGTYVAPNMGHPTIGAIIVISVLYILTALGRPLVAATCSHMPI